MKTLLQPIPLLLGLSATAALLFVLPAQGAVISVTQHTDVGPDLDTDPLATYTHKLDFPGDGQSAALPNGVQFSAVGAGLGTDPLTGNPYSLTMGNPSNWGSGPDVLNDFIYNGGQSAGAVETLTLGGLTPGTVYDTRLYYRNFGPRPNTVTVDTGSGPISLGTLNETPVGASNRAYWSIVTSTEGDSLAFTFQQQVSNDSWHQYAVSNVELGPGPPPPPPILDEVTVRVQATCDNDYDMYLSDSPTVQGTLIRDGNNNWQAAETFDFEVPTGTTMYLHVLGINADPPQWGGFIADLDILEHPAYIFSETGSQRLFTDPTRWVMSTDGWGVNTSQAVSLGTYGVGPWSGNVNPDFLPDVHWLWDARAGGAAGQLYLTAPITVPALIIPEPSTFLIWSLLAGLGIGAGWRRRKR